MYMSIKENNKEVRINILIAKDLRKQYKLYCLNLEIPMSERIRQLIEMDLDKKIK